MRSRSAAMAARSIATPRPPELAPEEPAEETVGQVAVAARGTRIRAAVRGQHEATRIKLDYARQVVDRTGCGRRAIGPDGDAGIPGVAARRDPDPEFDRLGVRAHDRGGRPEHEAERDEKVR